MNVDPAGGRFLGGIDLQRYEEKLLAVIRGDILVKTVVRVYRR